MQAENDVLFYDGTHAFRMEFIFSVDRNSCFQQTFVYKKGPPLWPNLVNLKSNTMKNTRAKIVRFYEFHKLFYKKSQILNYI